MSSTPASARQEGPLEVVQAFSEAENAHDLDRIVKLFADDAVLVNANGTFTGRDEIRQVYVEAFANNVHAVSRDFEVSGDEISFISAARLDPFVALGIESLDLRIDAVVREGLIRRWEVSLTPEAAAKFAAATSPPAE